MNSFSVFTPSRRGGIVFHVAILVILGGGAVYGLWQAGRAAVGPNFLLALLPALLALGIFPWLGYGLYALRDASYTLERDGLRLHWGLRQEDIPIDQIQWVRPASEYGALPLPLLRWPGAVLGERILADQRKIEYLADRSSNLLLVATHQRIFALSPSQPAEFLRAYERYAELGSIVSIPAQSQYPAFLLSRIWQERPARWILLGGWAGALLLWVWVILAIPGRSQIPWYLTATGQAGEFVPAVRLLLLPTLNLGVSVFDLVLGFFFFRRSEYKVLAYLFWLVGLIVTCLFGGGIFFILNFG